MGTAVMVIWGWWEPVTARSWEQGTAEWRFALIMPGAPSATPCLEEKMLRWCVNSWKVSRGMVSLHGSLYIVWFAGVSTVCTPPMQVLRSYLELSLVLPWILSSWTNLSALGQKLRCWSVDITLLWGSPPVNNLRMSVWDVLVGWHQCFYLEYCCMICHPAVNEGAGG